MNKHSLKSLAMVEAKFDSSIGKEVVGELESHGEDWYNHLQNILKHGCVSGAVSSLIYYDDTIKFHDEYENEIDEIIVEVLDETGLTFNDLLDDSFELFDIQALKNFKSWFAFESMASRINSYIEDEVFNDLNWA